MQSLVRHNASKMHETRSSIGLKKYTCECGKYYIHQQSLRNHKIKHHKTEQIIIPPILVVPSQQQMIIEKMQQEINGMKEELQIMKNKKAIPPEKMHQEINEMKEELQRMKNKKATPPEKMQHEINKMKEELQIIKNKKATPPLQKSRDIRKKITKETRKEIVDEQENTCGKCKEKLSSCFQMDHIVGIQFGGTNEKSNLMALCCECHAKKSIAENKCRQQIKEAIQRIISV